MLQIKENINLKAFNTFGIEVYCDYFVEINSEEDFQDLVKNEIYKSQEKLIIGGGSNLLFTKDFKGIVIKNNLKGITIVKENENEALLKASAGEVWHEFVLYCIDKNYAGIENLSLIPGCVGASPMQNIGAYGVEIKEVFEQLEAFNMESGELKKFNKKECEFGYRESVFKHKFRNKFFISSVTFKLKKQAAVNTSYGAINTELQAMNIVSPGIKDVSRAVINIRQSKLPDPKVTGNAGSFFKNPEVSNNKYNELKNQFENIVAYPLENGNYKLAAGWMIEQSGLKGQEYNGAAVHTKQALVLINKNNAKGKDVFELSTHVIKRVQDKFGVTLEREVNII
ncbi:UDP-N-acetylmuramate dehydrogenase [Aurantibacillus circumpalustris]|uniref:UDP-N-acetylmuramate dehydrogenase n=1 Tax=Aurantibacillus circumpalustris TaxID=3036359 RepID=UPI00295AA0AA|nr:UDP-N-acetylmuramate dehydrogenase [Aurantibacillus circumpalustris]